MEPRLACKKTSSSLPVFLTLSDGPVESPVLARVKARPAQAVKGPTYAGPSCNGPGRGLDRKSYMDTISQLQDKLHDMTKRLAHEIRLSHFIRMDDFLS